MSYESARAHLSAKGFEDRIMSFDVSSATVELAAAAIGCEPAKIAKSMTFSVGSVPTMIVCAGDAKISNSKFKARFGCKATMLTFDEVSEKIGHAVGGVCPFGILPGVNVFLDESLRRFDTVYPACGSSNTAVRLTINELEEAAAPLSWVDVCKLPEE